MQKGTPSEKPLYRAAEGVGLLSRVSADDRPPHFKGICGRFQGFPWPFAVPMQGADQRAQKRICERFRTRQKANKKGLLDQWK
jgi:hypothetical protein